MLALAAAVEKSSSHPLAAAIVSEARLRCKDLPETSEAQQIPGHGMVGIVNGQRVSVGRASADMRDPKGSPARTRIGVPALAGMSVVEVRLDEKPIALIGLSDRPRENARKTIDRLKRLGIRKAIMLTGDHA